MKKYCSFKNVKRRMPYIIYDASIPDVKERVEKALNFDTATAAADYLGMANPFHLNNFCSQEAILNQKKYKSDKHGGKLFVIRKVTKAKK